MAKRGGDASAVGMTRNVVAGLHKVAMTLRQETWRGASRAGLSASQVQALIILAGEPQLRANQIADRLGVTPASASDTLATLARKRLIARAVDPLDARAARFRLTRRGLGAQLRPEPRPLQSTNSWATRQFKVTTEGTRMNTRGKVLVADHNAERATQLRSTLSAEGWQVILARDAVSATALALRERPDAMVLSQSLPGGGGLVTLRRVRASVHTAGIPVIAIADEQKGDVNTLRLEGADECLPAQAEGAAVVACLQKCFVELVPVIEAPPAIIRHPDRLASLDRTGLLDSPPSEPFDTLTRVASALLSVPVALVSLVDRERQFFKSSIGLPEPWASKRETPLTHSFCQWVVADHAALVVADARNHPVLRDNRALHELGVVAYAGMPLTANSGEAIGSLCAIDTTTHDWSETETEVLRALTSVGEALIALAEFDARQDQGKAATEMDHIVQSQTTRAVGRGISAITGILRREQPALIDSDRQDLFSLLHWLGQQLVRITGT